MREDRSGPFRWSIAWLVVLVGLACGALWMRLEGRPPSSEPRVIPRLLPVDQPAARAPSPDVLAAEPVPLNASTAVSATALPLSVEPLSAVGPPPADRNEPSFVQGILRQASGMPVSQRCTVVLWPGDDPPDPPTRVHRKLTTATDTQGRFRVSAPAEGGRYTLCAWGGARRSLDLLPGEPREVDLVRREAPVLSGRVRSAGQPVRDVVVFAKDPAGFSRRDHVPSSHGSGYRGNNQIAATTDSSGEYRLPLPHEGRWTVDVSVPHEALPEAGRTPEFVAYGGRAVIDLELPSGSITGRVLDANTGRPLSRTEILLVGGRPEKVLTSTSRSDRAYQFSNLSDGTWKLSAERMNHLPMDPIEVRVSGGRPVVAPPITLTKGALIVGTVGGGRGSHVWAYPLDGQGQALHCQPTSGVLPDIYISAYPEAASARPAERNTPKPLRYVFPAMAPGHWRIVLSSGQEWNPDGTTPATQSVPLPQLSLESEVHVVGAVFLQLDWPAPPARPDQP